MHGPTSAIQIEHRLAPSTNHMHMSRPMIIEIDSHPQAAKSQDRWHTSSYHNPKRLGYDTAIACPFRTAVSFSAFSALSLCPLC